MDPLSNSIMSSDAEEAASEVAGSLKFQSIDDGALASHRTLKDMRDLVCYLLLRNEQLRMELWAARNQDAG